jgi:hypothetical protein
MFAVIRPHKSDDILRYCGSEFIRESFISDAANVLDVLAPSRMNPLPQIRRYARATVCESIREGDSDHE